MAESNVAVLNKVDLGNESRIRDNYYALSPILNFEKCVGIFRLCLKNGELHPPSWAMKMYSAFLGISYLTVFSIYLKIPAIIKGEESFFNIIDDVPSFFHMFNYITSIVSSAFFLSKLNIDVLINIAELDNQLLNININDFYRKLRNTNIKALIMICVIHGITVTIDVTVRCMLSEYVTVFAVVVPVFIIQKFEMMVFCLFVAMMTSRVSIINGYIAKFLEEKENNTVCTLCDTAMTVKGTNDFIGPPTDSNMKIRDLALMYNQVGSICSIINCVFNFQIFMSLVSTFVYIVIAICTSLYVYKFDNSSGRLVTIFIWCSMAILSVTIMCFVCEWLCYVRNTTKVLVNQIIMDYDLPNTMRVQAKAFMELIDAWPLRIYIYDMFSVDITLMLKFISVATTYLIIILQVFHYN